jgi:hypothetical protein
MVCTVTPNFFISRRRASEKPMQANLEEQYAENPAKAKRPREGANY